MKKPSVERDSDGFYVDTHAGRLRGDEVGSLEELSDKIEQNMPRPEEFLEAWKDGVSLAGSNYFKIRSDSVESATDKDELRPDLEVITSCLGAISPGERVFLLSMYQFFSDSTVRDLCVEFGFEFPTLADIANLDFSHRTIISRLIDSYCGW